MNGTIAALFAFILVVAVVLLFIVSRAPRKKGLDQDWYLAQWSAIESQFHDGRAGQVLAVVNADKLLDRAMRDKGFRGQTMGERLKGHPKVFSDINSIWRAHKIRNQIAHEHTEHSENECKSAIYSLRQGLKDIGAIR